MANVTSIRNQLAGTTDEHLRAIVDEGMDFHKAGMGLDANPYTDESEVAAFERGWFKAEENDRDRAKEEKAAKRAERKANLKAIEDKATAEGRKIYTEQEITEMMDTMDVRLLHRPLLKMWARQTDSERADHTTKDHNKVGFSAFDAEFAGSLVEWHRKGRSFSRKQEASLRKMLKKYRKQLTDIANQGA